MSHKVLIRFDGYKNVRVENREIWPAAIWHLFSVFDPEISKKMHDSSNLKGFVWHVFYDKPSHEFVLEFSSIDPMVLNAVSQGARQCKDSGKAFQLADNVILKVKDINEVEDYVTSSGRIQLSAVTGVNVDTKIRFMTEEGQKKVRASINPVNDPLKFCNRLKNNLLEKIGAFFPNEKINPNSISVNLVSGGREVAMPFRTIPLRGFCCSIVLYGPKIAIDTALYAGIGRHNGLGFGMMVPAAKKRF